MLDKTGTVTLGHLEVVASRPCGEATEEELMRAAAFCAAGSRHPVSRAVVRAAGAAGLMPTVAVESVEEQPGRGVVAGAEGRQLSCSARATGAAPNAACRFPKSPEHAGAVVWVGRDDVVLGCLLLADLPRPEARAAVIELRELGLTRVVLLTGDRRHVAAQVAKTLDIEHVVAEVLPEQKLQTVQAEKAAGRTVMVVGDGVNDALALASGDVGVAMGAMGSDVALKSADVALMTNDLARLPLAVLLSRRTRSTINQNLFIGAGSSVLMLALAGFGIVSPIVGAVLHNAGEIYILFNSARLLGFGRMPGKR